MVRAGLVAVALLTSAGLTLGTLSAMTSAADVGKQEPLTIVTATGRAQFKVEIAETDAAREEGLMFRSSLPEDAGMLFDFKKTETVYFWMKNTYLALDMIFIRDDGTVAHIAENATPLSEATIASGDPVRFVLEVDAGTVKRIGLKVGDRIIHRLIKSGS